ncbi:hypothetical protein KGM_207754 [Danaus plexippus plexippus]|uniref:Uncharacterized protein n=1 Tax=Danaus plexippus plexippus TaxID=278856 RepID=A0A212FK10_DANPL|nr:hypothetical protein KGM_207754 [Danaus plexippus plexippus]
MSRAKAKALHRGVCFVCVVFLRSELRKLDSVNCEHDLRWQIDGRCSKDCASKDLKGSMRARNDYGDTKGADCMKFKCRVCRDTSGRTMGVRLPLVAVIGLLFMTLASSAAAPLRTRTGRSAHEQVEKQAVSSNIYIKNNSSDTLYIYKSKSR